LSTVNNTQQYYLKSKSLKINVTIKITYINALSYSVSFNDKSL